jgi:hypothetical protein
MRQESKIIQALIECFPNDAELGREIRKLYKQKKECIFYTYDDINIGEERLCATCGQPESKH